MTHYDWQRAVPVNGHEAFMASNDDQRFEGLIYRDQERDWTLRIEKPDGTRAEVVLVEAKDSVAAVEHGDAAMYERVTIAKSAELTASDALGREVRQRLADHHGFELQSTDGGVEVYGKDGLSDTIEYNQGEWHMFQRDEHGQPVSGPEGLPGHEATQAFDWLEQQDRSDLEHWMAAERRFSVDRDDDRGYER